MQEVLLIEDASISYRIEPFYFEKGFSEIHNPIGFRPLTFTKEMFYDHIDNLMFLKEKDSSYNNQIGKSFQIDWNKSDKILYHDSYLKKDVPFPAKETEYEYLVDGKKNSDIQKYIRFKIENVHLLVSEMKVGFLVYDIKIIELYEVKNGVKESLTQSVENYEWAMYYLRKLQIANKGYLVAAIQDPEQVILRKEFYMRRDAALRNNESFTEEEPAEPNLVPVKVKWTDLTNGLLKSLGEVHSFTNQKKVGHHALLYTSAFIQPPEEIEATDVTRKNFELMIANKVYKISHGYRETYYKDVKVDDILRPFDNIMWSLSSEGVSNIVYTLDNEQAMKFFNDTFKTKRETNYYFMYILGLLQKYSLLYFTIRSTQVLYQSSIYSGAELTKEERDKELKRTREFYSETLKFTVHGYYEQVSYHSHYNEIYVQLIKALRIPEMQQELSPKAEAFHQVIESLVFEQEMKEKESAKEEKEKQNNIFQTITFFLLPASIATGILGMNVPLITKSNNFYLGYVAIGVTLLTTLLLIFLNKNKSISARTIAVASAVFLSIIIMLDIRYDFPNQEEETEQIKIEEQSDASNHDKLPVSDKE
jgi:hypothetical protein